LKSDGKVVRWSGDPVVDDFFANEVLTTDDGSGGGKPYPATVPDGLRDVVAIAAGDNFCLAITTNNAVAEKFRR
jgi:hypothetical protein